MPLEKPQFTIWWKMARPQAHLNSRKPFKVLAQLKPVEIDVLETELRQHAEIETGKVYARLHAYVSRWLVLDAKEREVTLKEFVEGTDLPRSANAFDKLSSQLYHYLQGFLARRELENDPVLTQQVAFRAYLGRNQDWKEVRRRHGEAHRELDKYPQSSDLLQDRLILDFTMARLANERTVPASERGYLELLQKVEANYALQKLRLMCALVNDRKIFKGPGAEQLTRLSPPPFNPDWPELAQLYYRAYQLLQEEEDDASKAALKELLEQQQPQSTTYPREDMMDLYGYLLNAWTRRVNRGDQEALGELSALHDHLLEKGLLFENGCIDSAHFKNVIGIKIRNKQVKRARAFFEEHADRIFNDPDRNAARYNHALLLYAEERLEEAAWELEELCAQAGNLKLDQYYGLDIRAVLLKVYFDSLFRFRDDPRKWDETDEKMYRLLDAFEGYIERKKLPVSRKHAYARSRGLIQSMYQLAFRGSAEDPAAEIARLTEEILEGPKASDAWFAGRLKWVINAEG